MTVAECAGVVLDRRTDYAGAARETVNQACRGLERDVINIAQTLTFELVSNAVNYAPGTIYVEISRSAQRLRVSVDDGSSASPRYPRAGVLGANGRGLMLVEYLAARWGVSTRDRGKRVWFELGPPDRYITVKHPEPALAGSPRLHGHRGPTVASA